MSLAKQEFTNAGRSMLGRAQNAERLTISKIVVGSGSATQPSDLWPLTALRAQEMNVVISSKVDLGGGVMLVEGSLRSDQAPHAFDLREVGVMAHIAAEADQLYSVGNVFAEAPDHIDPAAPTIQVFKIKLIIDRIPTGQITVSISPSENVIGENIGAASVGAGAYRDAAGNVLYFKRFVEGPAIDIEETPDTITIGQPMLKNNLDLYVPMNYPGITDPNVLFPTIQDAHNYLLKFMIPTDKYATIHVAAGSFTGRLYLWHPNGSQIALIGWPREDRVVTAVNYVSPTTKNVQVTGNIAALVATYPVWLMNCLGWTGGTWVTAKSGQVLTVATWDQGGRPPYNITGLGTNPRLSWNPTVIVTPDAKPWTGDEILCACNYGSISNMTFFGGYRALALSGDRCALSNIFCLAAQVGIACAPLTVLNGNSDIIVTDCDFGMNIGTTLNGIGGTRSVDFCANACGCGIAVGGNGGLGAVPGVGAPTGVIYLINNAEGVRNWGNTLSIGNVLFSKNDTGFDAAYCGTIIFGPFPNTPYDNRLDLYAHGMGYIEYFKGTGAEPTCNPVKNAAGNQNAYIHV